MTESRPTPAVAATARLSDSGAPPDRATFPVVAIGASAGGLEACRKLLDQTQPGAGMAFILVQHLDPTHKSLLVDLLSSHTSMTVVEAHEGLRLEPDHLYVIPPGTYLAVAEGMLQVTVPGARHGARLPYDFLLNALAEDCGPRTIAVVLSGTGEDGSLGVKAIKARGGFVLAQDPGEAGFDGMPRSAILTGGVDQILPVARIPQAMARIARRMAADPGPPRATPRGVVREGLAAIIELLRLQTSHDFSLYKPGTLQRRVERRMALAAIGPSGFDLYLDRLRRDPGERDLLAKDLLIHVTSFFRDPKTFELLAESALPDLIRRHAQDQPLRVWIAGCSTGEETYSLVMILREQIAAAGVDLKLQVFASDVDPEAVAVAREGLYPETIAADVSPTRLAAFFTREERGWRISPDLRGVVVFSVQNLLSDPPFSRLDLISCRNLLIYFRPEAQSKVVAIFHFALREGGLLLLGGSESVGSADGRFEVVSKPARIYRQIGRSRPGEFGFLSESVLGVRPTVRPLPGAPATHPASLADLCRRLVIETHAPAAVLINRKHECLYSLGPTDRYLRVAAGAASLDLLAMARDGLRVRLAAAIQRAFDEAKRIQVPGGRLGQKGESVAFTIDVQPLQVSGELFMLVCFVDQPRRASSRPGDTPEEDAPRIAELERELEATRAELQSAIRNLEIAYEEQSTVNEEALSVNEEFQSTNEELLTSKEELQSLNEELTALNSQLQETLERQRMTANDLQNILYSTDVATLFLDAELKIRFFTPATKALFNVLPGDVGRPLADLHFLADDVELLDDARRILSDLVPLEREIEAHGGGWFSRRILPYRAHDQTVEGVVITFIDITERKRAAEALEAARRAADRASVAKSRFLAAASHDLRQPLQTLALVQGLLARSVEGEAAQKLVGVLGQTLGAMSGMLDTLLDINQIDSGAVKADVVSVSIETLLGRLKDEFDYHAAAKGLELKVVSCSAMVDSDPALLEQMIRNLLSNAIKYTAHGKVLVGCRRHDKHLSLEVWDTGIGISEAELSVIFEEYHQVENTARERSRGLGLGLSIVRRLGRLLDHKIGVRSQAGLGSVFTIVLPRSAVAPPEPNPELAEPASPAGPQAPLGGAILVVEDDPEVRELLRMVLEGEGHSVAVAPNAAIALDLLARGQFQTALVLADYNLPGEMTGLDLVASLRGRGRPTTPAVILTGDISTEALRDIAEQNCTPLHKPVKAKILNAAIQTLLAATPAQPPPKAPEAPGSPKVYVVDDDRHIRAALTAMLEADGYRVAAFDGCEAFLAAYRPGGPACLLIDAYLPGMNGLDLLHRLRANGDPLPAIMITGEADVNIAVQAMKAGASDFIEKPVGPADLRAGVSRALDEGQDLDKVKAARDAASDKLAALTPRQREILDRVVAGHPSKIIAADLGISQRTVENHRSAIMHKTGSTSLPALARLALAAASRSQEARTDAQPAAEGPNASA
jgi:two-component system CheB/CheR fusion protein